MRVVFDENYPPAIARMLMPLVASEGASYQVTDVFALGLRSVADTAVLAAICDGVGRGVLVTTDKKMRSRPHERSAIVAHGAVVIVGVSNWNQQSNLWLRAGMMLWWWPMIVEGARIAESASFLELPWNRNPKPLRRWRIQKAR